jgi:hypothetical protein
LPFVVPIKLGFFLLDVLPAYVLIPSIFKSLPAISPGTHPTNSSEWYSHAFFRNIPMCMELGVQERAVVLDVNVTTKKHNESLQVKLEEK